MAIGFPWIVENTWKQWPFSEGFSTLTPQTVVECLICVRSVKPYGPLNTSKPESKEVSKCELQWFQYGKSLQGSS